MTYSRVTHHGAMVFDDNRNELYAKAIRQLVRPGSVVLDLGAGLGLHGLLAAAAGASRVYLVEPEPVVRAALDAARLAGLQDRIVILNERIEDVQLPQQVDLLISVFAGNLLFSEDLLPALYLARDRWLKPGGALLPDRAQLLLAPVCAPDLHDKHVGRWSRPAMGMDYSQARAFAANEVLWLRREDLGDTRRLAPGATLIDVDFSTATRGDCRGEVQCRIETSGLCHGLLAWIRIHLLGEWLSTDPQAPEVHWSPVVLPIDPPLQVTAGENVRMQLIRPERGDWTWSVTGLAGSRRHSTFLANPDGLKALSLMAPASRPGLSPKGHRALQILGRLQEGLSNQAIADSLAPPGTPEAAKALQEVQALALRFGGRS